MSSHPEGVFKARIRDHGFGESKNGTEYLWMRFATKESEITGYFYLSEGAAPWTIKKLRTLGYDGKDFGDLEDGSRLKETACQIGVKVEMYNGKESAKVSSVWHIDDKNAGGPQHDANVASKVRRLNGLFKDGDDFDPADDIPF